MRWEFGRLRAVTIILLAFSIPLLVISILISSIPLAASSILLILASIIFETSRRKPRVIAVEDLERSLRSLKQREVPPNVRQEIYELEEKIRKIRYLKEVSQEAKQRLLEEYRRKLMELQAYSR